MHAAHVHGPGAARRLGPTTRALRSICSCGRLVARHASIHLHRGYCLCPCAFPRCKQLARRVVRHSILLTRHRKIARLRRRRRRSGSCRRSSSSSSGSSSSNRGGGGSCSARGGDSVGHNCGCWPCWYGRRHQEKLLQRVRQLMLAAVVLPRRQEHLAEALYREGWAYSEAIEGGDVPFNIHRGARRRCMLLLLLRSGRLLRCVARSRGNLRCVRLRLRLRLWRRRCGKCVQRVTEERQQHRLHPPPLVPVNSKWKQVSNAKRRCGVWAECAGGGRKRRSPTPALLDTANKRATS